MVYMGFVEVNIILLLLLFVSCNIPQSAILKCSVPLEVVILLGKKGTGASIAKLEKFYFAQNTLEVC